MMEQKSPPSHRDNVAELRAAVERMHGAAASYVQSVPVTESFEGKPAWEGVVHVFDLTAHPKASRAYAWSSPMRGDTKRKYSAVLHVPPIDSPQKAVRASIVAGYWNPQS